MINLFLFLNFFKFELIILIFRNKFYLFILKKFTSALLFCLYLVFYFYIPFVIKIKIPQFIVDY
jgi:hypothetical protein